MVRERLFPVTTESLIRELICRFDHDPDRDGLQETPRRVAEAFAFLVSGQDADPAKIMTCFEAGTYDELVTVAGIPFCAMCEHHLMPFFGVAHIAYIPNGRIVGLSKIPRLVQMYARRLTVQERVTQKVADALWECLQPIGVGVVLRARHMCIESRGVEKPGTITYTSAMLGAFKTQPEARAEFLQFVQRADQQSGNI